MVRIHAGHFLFDGFADINDERSTWMYPQMNAEIVQQQRRPKRITVEIGSTELRPESCIVYEAAGCDMVWVSILPVRCQNDLRPGLPEDFRQYAACFQSGLQAAVGQL